MIDMSRRRFLQGSVMTGGTLLMGDALNQILAITPKSRPAYAAEPIKIGILDPLSSPYKTSSIHDVHGANVAVDLFNKNGGVPGRPVVMFEADDASNPETAVKFATKFIKEDLVDALMGTFNGDCALAVSALAQKENKLFMVTGSYLPELTGVACNAQTFVFMSNARMLARAALPQLVKAYGTRWYVITTGTLDGKSAAQAIVEVAEAHRVEFLGEAMMPFGSTDFTSALTAASRSDGRLGTRTIPASGPPKLIWKAQSDSFRA